MTSRNLLRIITLSVISFLASSQSRADDTADKQQRELLLRGNELWGHYCANCHNAPPSSDRAPHEWDIIALHMRTRAAIPAEHVKAIFAYLRSH
jgi:hypothetical protein